MEPNEVRDIITGALIDATEGRKALWGQDVEITPLGNRVHLCIGPKEYEIVIRTMDPKGPSRLDASSKGS